MSLTGPWHIVEVGESYPKVVNGIIEVPKGSKNKYEIDKKSGFLKLDRTLYSSVHYPANYGFIPQTYGEDNDPLDILVLGQEPVYPMTIISAKPIGVLRMKDQGQVDDKIIAVHKNDPEYSEYNQIDDLSKHKLIEIRKFFEDYKQLEGKNVEVLDVLGLEKTYEIIEKSIASYKLKLKKGHFS